MRVHALLSWPSVGSCITLLVLTTLQHVSATQHFADNKFQ